MLRLEIGILALLALLGSGAYILHLTKQNAVTESALESAQATIVDQKNEKARTDKILVKARQQREALSNELEQTKSALLDLKLTPKQAECNHVPLPAGYVDKLLHAND